MNPDLLLGIGLFFFAGLVWLAGGTKRPPGSPPFASLLGSVFLVAACSGTPVPPFVPPDVGEPDLGDSACFVHEFTFEDYLVGLPAVVHIDTQWSYNWCFSTLSDYQDFEGQWYFQDWSTTFSNWDQINQVILYVDDRPLAWITPDHTTGFDPGFDVAPFAEFNVRPSGKAGTWICLPVTVDLDAYTARQRLNFEYVVVSKICPTKEWTQREDDQ